MSLSASHNFDFEISGLSPVENGDSVLVTGDDLQALESVFYRLMTPVGEEHPIVVSTSHDARSIQRNLDTPMDVDPTILTCEGRSTDDAVTVLDDPGNLTELGMELSARFQEHAADDVRAGIFHTTDLCGAAEDTRAVYRFLNSNLMTNLRRQSAVGIAAIHTDVDIRTDVNSIVKGMETSFTGRIHIDSAGLSTADVTISGLSGDGAYSLDI